MTSTPHASAPRSLPLDALETALEQSHDVKAKVEACADDLASANDVAKDRMAEGATTLPAAQVLQSGLAVVAQRLMGHARDEDTVCRNGGDEFLYLLINPGTHDAVARIAGLVRSALAAPIDLDALRFAITPSIGIALYPEHGNSADSLIAHADAAMYRAKQLRSACEFFEAPATPAAVARTLQT